MKAITISRNGGPEVLELVDVELGPPRLNEVTLRHTAIGVNFSDINVRKGGFYIGDGPKFPVCLGNEAAGVVENVGADVQDFAAGDRVAYAGTGGCSSRTPAPMRSAATSPRNTSSSCRTTSRTRLRQRCS